ncbi:MAG: leucine-rich repeat domain-containing protein, partial [Bacteroidales bacterium]|nr:leucine-rich repeat domain-containing protein [Bacteroidales bacterium]
IPEKVTTIGDNAFSGCSNLTSITIPEKVTTIGDNAFSGCSNLTSITIPEKVTTIGDNAFSGCSNLTSITISENVTSIGDSAFVSTKWYDNQPNGIVCFGSTLYKYKGMMPSNTYIIPDNIQKIAGFAFSGCSNLTSITIPNSVTTLCDNAFSGCSNLTSITIPSSVTEIGDNAFSGCSNLTSITIPNSVTTIGDNTFSGCSNLTSITIPNSVTNIEDEAFTDCSNLISITIPNSVKKIGSGAFYGCSNLKEFIIEDGDNSLLFGPLYFIDYEELYNCISCNGGYYYEHIKSYGKDIFENTILENLYIGRNISTAENYDIGGYIYTNTPFYQITTLSSVTIGEKVTDIPDLLFEGCQNITSITIPENVKYISPCAFYRCDNLINIEIEDSDETLIFKSDIFDGYWADDWRKLNIQNLYLGRDLECLSYYNSYSPFNDINTLNSVTIGNKVKKISNSLFSGCKGLSSIIIPESVTFIGDSVFYNSSLTSITIPKNVTSIGVKAFSDCPLEYINVDEYNTNYTSLNGVLYNKNKTKLIYCLQTIQGEYKIPSSVSIIEKYAFNNCSTLSKITIPISVATIRDGAFSGCRGLEEIYIFNATPPVCGKNIFYGVNKSIPVYVASQSYGTTWNGLNNILSLFPLTFTALNDDNIELTYNIPTFEKYYNREVEFVAGTEVYRGSIVIPTYVNYDNRLFCVKTISKEAFKGCTTLTSVILPKKVEEIGEEAFNNCSRISNIYFPNSLKKIGEAAFEDCVRLKELIIGTGIETIGAFAFVGCIGLEEIYSLSSTPAECDIDAFLDVDTTIPVYIPVGSKSAYQAAPEWKNFTNFIESEFTGVEDTEISTTDIKVIAGNGLEINNYYGNLRIVNLSGQVVKDIYVNGYAQIILPKGIYIVVTENNAQKVVL